MARLGPLPQQAPGRALLCSSSKGGAQQRWGPGSACQLPLGLVVEQVGLARCGRGSVLYLPRGFVTCFLPLCLGSSGEMTTVGLKTGASLPPSLFSSLTPWLLGWFKCLLMWEKAPRTARLRVAETPSRGAARTLPGPGNLVCSTSGRAPDAPNRPPPETLDLGCRHIGFHP